MHRQELENYTQQLLNAPLPGLLPQWAAGRGRPEIRKIVTGVTANQLLLEQAVGQEPMPFWCTMASSGKTKTAG